MVSVGANVEMLMNNGVDHGVIFVGDEGDHMVACQGTT